jgi:5-carboxyvanillate decarboxylase
MIDRRTFNVALLGAAASVGVAQAQQGSQSTSTNTAGALRLIATEEAFTTPEQLAAMSKLSNPTKDPDLSSMQNKARSLEVESPLTRTTRALIDIGEQRIAEMDRAGVAMHVLSLTSPGVQMLDVATAHEVARTSNDRLAEAVRKYPTRFAGLASFAPQDPAGAVKEIERAIRDLKLHGLIVNSHTNEEYLDRPKYWPILEAAEALDAALYIHPRNPPAAILPFLELPDAGTQLSSAMWGFQLDTGLHAARLIMSGIFDRFPKLKIVLGHMGEGLPFWLFRMDQRYRMRNASGGVSRSGKQLQRLPSEYVKSNVLITTSGVFWNESLEFCRNAIGADNIMFAIDYPYEDSVQAARFMNAAPLPPAELRKVAYENAERVFHIRRS